MRALVLMVAVVLPLSAIADTCITMEGPTVINGCQSCVELTVRALRPRAEQAAGLFTDQSRSVRLDAGARETLQGSERWAIIDFRPCH
jgi:hypothetical protein